MRDYTRIDKYLDQLIKDIYPQPQDPGHTAWAEESINYFLTYAEDVKYVLDVGCGEAFCQEMFEKRGMSYMGICLGEDFKVAASKERTVAHRDFSFTGFEDNSFDFIYSRHSLEHSPFPLLTLMEWHRITEKYLALVVPSHVFWEYKGQNHYFVLNDLQWRNLFEKVGFECNYYYSKTQNMTTDPDREPVQIEHWYLLEKK